jgi:hypothetical protein
MSAKIKQKTSSASDATACSLSLNASGTPNQLIVFLRNAADQIEMDEKHHDLPWFCVTNGCGFIGDFKVSSANAIGEARAVNATPPHDQTL